MPSPKTAKPPRRTAERILDVTLDLFNRFGEPNVSTTLIYWLSYEYVRDPRHALEPDAAGTALARGAYHVLSLLAPYLDPASGEHLHALASPYRKT